MVTATDLTRGELIRLPWDYGRYGLQADDQLVSDAVRASMSIPFFFEPTLLEDRTNQRTSVLVDGGTLSNFPIDAFDRLDGDSPRWPTFGVKLFPVLPAGNTRVFPILAIPRPPFLRLLESLITTLIVGRDQAYLSQPWVSARSIFVNTDDVNFVDFNLSAEDRQKLFTNGMTAVEKFLDHWDFVEYKKRFRLPAAKDT